ncbi:MAG: hypothetical protein ABFQ62_03375 [Patescibacteria group bacterium]
MPTSTRTILQVPMSAQLRRQATKVATEMGFSSLQEAIRVLTTKLANHQLANITFQEPAIQLSEKNAKRYDKMVEEIESGKVEAPIFNDVDDLIESLMN